MPGEDGFELIKQLNDLKVEIQVVFVTAHEKYAIKAIRASALDYLLKPVNKSELKRSIEALSDSSSVKNMQDQLGSLLSNLQGNKKIKFRHRTGFSLVAPDEIIYCEADSNYSNIELEGGKTLTFSVNLGKLEELLPQDRFCRISRSVIINMKYLVQVDRKSLVCELVNESVHKLTVSRKYLKLLEQACEFNFKMN
jgi:two-component system LytT family response regulator